MRRQWDIDPDAFDRLLKWLDPDRDLAGAKYEEIRRRLIRIFVCRGCPDSEDLADETIDRVIRRMPDLADSYSGEPANYFCGVARNVFLEYTRRYPTPVPPPPPPPDEREDNSQMRDCLDQCTEVLSGENRYLIKEYYKEDKQAKIRHRRELALELGITVPALRLRAHRVRTELQACTEKCVSDGGPS